MELVRYIHLNPLRARLVADIKELNEYPWCGHSVLMGNKAMEGQRIDLPPVIVPVAELELSAHILA